MTDDVEQRLRRALHEQARRVEPPADPTGDVRRRVRRHDRRQRSTVGLACAAVLVLVTAAAVPALRGPDHVVETVSPSAVPESSGPDAAGDPVAQALPNTCHNAAGPFRVRYPAGWHTNQPRVADPYTGAPVDPCRYFHPEPFAIGDADESFSGDTLAVGIAVSSLPADEYRPYDADVDDVAVENVSVDGFPAVRIDATAGDYAPHPEGHPPPWERLRAHVIDTGDRRIIVTTSDQAEGVAFEEAAAVHDRMVASLAIGEAAESPASAAEARRPRA